MTYTVAQLKQDIEGGLHGASLNAVHNVNGLIQRAVSEFLLDVDPQETKRTSNMVQYMFSGSYNYPLPSDLKGNKIIWIKPEANRTLRDRYVQTYENELDIDQLDGTTQPEFIIDFNSSVKTLRMQNPWLADGMLIDECDSLDGWAVSGSASNLHLDRKVKVSGLNSINFNLDSGPNPSVAGIEKTFSSPIDISAYKDIGSFLMYLYIPDTRYINKINIEFGSSPTDYYKQTVTGNRIGAFTQEFNHLQFDFDQDYIQTFGTPDDTNITFFRVLIDYTGIFTPFFRLDSIQLQNAYTYKIKYYSKFLFRDIETNEFKEVIEDEDDIINLDTESYHLLTDKCIELAAQQVDGFDAGFDTSFFSTKYEKSLKKYRTMYKSETRKPRTFYYKGVNRRMGGGAIY